MKNTEVKETAQKIEFCLPELEEAKRRGLTIDEVIQDLTIRSCTHMQPVLTAGFNPLPNLR